MENKLQPSEPGALQENTQAATFNLPGDGNTLVAHTDAVYNSFNMVLLNGNSSLDGDLGTTVEINPNYYNLIVVGDASLVPNGCVFIKKDEAITQSTTVEIKETYASLSPEAIAKVKTFPALIATKNHYYNKTDAEHKAIYGVITGIEVQDNGIKVSYQMLNPVPQQRLNELVQELSIENAPCCNELDNTHWAIKHTNLIKVLQDAGVQILHY